MGHENKCANLHGHNYVVYIEAAGDLDNIGRIIDFSVLKERVGGWIDEHWDHGFILWEKDSVALRAISGFRKEVGVPRRLGDGLDQKLYVMSSNPTAENMAQYLLDIVCPSVLATTGVEVVKVVVWETENCYATVTK